MTGPEEIEPGRGRRRRGQGKRLMPRIRPTGPFYRSIVPRITSTEASGVRSALGESVERGLESGHGAGHVVQLVEAEEAEPEGREVLTLTALQRHARGHLEAERLEGGARLEVGSV